MTVRPDNTRVNQATKDAVRKSQEYFRQSQYAEGYWLAAVESNPTTEAE